MASRLFQKFVSRIAWLAFLFFVMFIFFNLSVPKDKREIKNVNSWVSFMAENETSKPLSNAQGYISEKDNKETFNELINHFNDWYKKKNFTKVDIPRVNLVLGSDITKKPIVPDNGPQELLVETYREEKDYETGIADEEDNVEVIDQLDNEEKDYDEKLEEQREREKQFEHGNHETVIEMDEEGGENDSIDKEEQDYDDKLQARREEEKRIVELDNHETIVDNEEGNIEQIDNSDNDEQDYDEKLEQQREIEKKFELQNHDTAVVDEEETVELKDNLDMKEMEQIKHIEDNGMMQRIVVISKTAEVKTRKTNSTTVLELDKIPFLPNYRNPCWLEPLPSSNPYVNNRYGGKKQGYMSNLAPSWNNLYSTYKLKGRTEILRCLPYFFIGGFPKCGTTDLYDKLIHHPMIEGCLFKEPHYWTRWRFWTDKCFWHMFMCADGSNCLPDFYQCDGRQQCRDGSDELDCDAPHNCSINNGGCTHTCTTSVIGTPKCTCPRGYKLKPDKKTCVGGTVLSDYIDLFDIAADKIQNFTQLKYSGQGMLEFHPKITGEATPATFWDNHRWPDEPSNYNQQTEPVTLTAHIITHLMPNVKNIVIVRNPTNRLYSDLLYFKPTATPQYFHEKVIEAIQWFNNCTKHKSLRSCVYEPMSGERPPEGRYWQPVERIRIGMYSEYLKDWLKIVPPNQIKVVKLEDYSEDRITVLQNVIKFLELEPMPSDHLYKWGSNGFKNSGSAKYARQGQMLNETRALLNDFYRPFNRELANILNDNKYSYD